MQTNHRHYILLLVALITLAVSSFGYYLFNQTITAQAIESSRIIKEAATLDEQKQREQDVASAYAKSAEDRSKLMSLLVQQDKVVDLIEEIEKIGVDTSTALELSGITSEEAVTEKGTATSHFGAHVDARGTWAEVMHVLILIENMPHAVSLSNVRLTEAGDTSSSAELSVKAKTPAKEIKVKQWRLTLDIRVLTLAKK